MSETNQEIINQVVTLSEQRETLETEIDGFAKQIRFLEDQITATDAEIKTNQEKIDRTKTELEHEQKILSEYFRVLYEDEQTSLFEKIVKAQSFSDFIDRSEYLNTIKGHFSDSVIRVRSLKKELQKKQQRLGEAMITNQLAKVSLDKQKAEKNKQLSDLTEQEKLIRVKFSERLKKLGVTGVPYCKKDGKVIKAKYTMFSFPTDCGYISQGIGNTVYASIDKGYGGAPHNGIDVAVNTGTPIKSIGKGVVFAKGAASNDDPSKKPWGNWIIIKHDKVKIENSEIQFYSLYAHMVMETHLNANEKVDENTVIGFVGGSGGWDPHLHFSLFNSESGWANDKPGPYPGNFVDPLNYIDIPISTVGTDWDPQFAH